MSEPGFLLQPREKVEERYRQLFWRITTHNGRLDFPLSDDEFASFVAAAASLSILQNDFILGFAGPENRPLYYYAIEEGLYRSRSKLYAVLQDATEMIPLRHCQHCLQLSMVGTLCESCITKVYGCTYSNPEFERDLMLAWKLTYYDLVPGEAEYFRGKTGFGYQLSSVQLPAGPPHWYVSPFDALRNKRDEDYLLAALVAQDRRYLKHRELLSWGSVLPVTAFPLDRLVPRHVQVLFNDPDRQDEAIEECNRSFWEATLPDVADEEEAGRLEKVRDNWPATDLYV